MPTKPRIRASRLAALDAFLFDLDGVLTPTVDVHLRAWSRLFKTFLADRGVTAPYTDEDYFRYIDGKPRVDGVRTMLAARGLSVPEGTPEDSADAETVWGLGYRKNSEFSAVLDSDGVTAYPGSLDFLRAVRDAGYRVAVVSSSRNAMRVLESAGLRDAFPIVVDGLVAAERHLPGKPKPDTYLYAAELLDLTPEQCAVIEDARSGVESGRSGNFGLVIGVDRGVGAENLLASGADCVVGDLVELLPAVEEARLERCVSTQTVPT